MAFNKVALAFDSFDTRADVGFKSSVLNDVIFLLPALKQPMKDLLNEVSLKKAAEGRKDTMWINSEKYPQIADIDLVSFFMVDIHRSLLKWIQRQYKPSKLSSWTNSSRVCFV